MKVGICIPWDTPFVWTQPMFTIMNLQCPDGWEKKYFRGEGWCPANRHNAAVTKAMIWGCDYILILGADQLFEEDTLIRLASHVPQWDMVSGLVPARGTVEAIGKPFGAFGFKLKPSRQFEVRDQSVEENWDRIGPDDPPQEIHSIGTGVLLLKSKIFDTMHQPWFKEYVMGGELYARKPVMDTQFVKHCVFGAGFRLFLDTTVIAKHLDAFHIDLSFMDRFADMKDINWVPAKGV